MNTRFPYVIRLGQLRPQWQLELIAWAPVIVGLLALYVPSLIDLFAGPWSQDGQMHGPVILGLALWLMYRKWPAMELAAADRPTSPWGWPVFSFGVLFYALGRSQSIGFLEVGSVIWVLAGLILLQRGAVALKSQWFALFFMLFMIPLPGSVVAAMTLPMKMAVSYVVEEILYGAGYPISRSGVILQIGDYMLMVADACAGLHTLLTLEALGLLYLNLVRRDSTFRNIGLAALIVPISFSANVIRVMALTLITFHFGAEAGQGFLHKFAGMVLFMTALLLIIGFDTAIKAFESYRQRFNARVSSSPTS